MDAIAVFMGFVIAGLCIGSSLLGGLKELSKSVDLLKYQIGRQVDYNLKDYNEPPTIHKTHVEIIYADEKGDND